MKYCPHCGSSIVVQGKFCPECGKSLKGGSISDTESLMQEALKALKGGDTFTALNKIENVIKEDPSNERAWNNKGLILSKDGSYSEAVDAFDIAIKNKRDVPAIWYGKGIALMNLDQPGNALECFDTALNFDSKYIKAKKKRSECLDLIKKKETRDQEIVGDPCPNCAGIMRFSSDCDQWWCDNCNVYPYLETSSTIPPMMKPLKPMPPPVLHSCGTPLRFIDEYGKWYCDICEAYDNSHPPPGSEEPMLMGPAYPVQPEPCPRCRELMELIPEYNKWYCNSCQLYG